MADRALVSSLHYVTRLASEIAFVDLAPELGPTPKGAENVFLLATVTVVEFKLFCRATVNAFATELLYSQRPPVVVSLEHVNPHMGVIAFSTALAIGILLRPLRTLRALRHRLKLHRFVRFGEFEAMMQLRQTP